MSCLQKEQQLARHIRQVARICDVMLVRLTDTDKSDLHTLLDILEDTAESFLDVADQVRDDLTVINHLVAQPLPQLKVLRGGRSGY